MTFKFSDCFDDIVVKLQDNDSWRRSEQYGIQVLHMSQIVFKFSFFEEI